MITKEQARLQLARIADLNFFPKTEAGVTELRLALEVADTPAIAKQVINDWLAGSPACPKPSELRAAAYAENDRIKPGEASPGPYDAYKTMMKMGGNAADRKFLELWIARRRELADNPALAQFHPDAEGRYHRTPTELSERLRTGAW